jgi:hypothetical protein
MSGTTAEWDPTANGGGGGWVVRHAPGDTGATPSEATSTSTSGAASPEVAPTQPVRSSKPTLPDWLVEAAAKSAQPTVPVASPMPPRPTAPPPTSFPSLTPAPLELLGDVPPVPPAPPARSGRSKVVAIVAAIAVVSAAATGGIVYWLTRPSGDDRASTTPAATVVPTEASGDSDLTPSDEPTTVPTPTPSELATESAASVPAESPSADASPAPALGKVTLTDSLTGSTQALAAAGTLTQFYTAINERRLSDAYALYSAAQRKKLGGYQSWAAGYASTADDQVTMVGLTAGSRGRVIAHVQFRSQQAPTDSPDGMSSCLWWRIAYTLVPSGVAYLIDEVHPDVVAPQKAYTSCG